MEIKDFSFVPHSDVGANELQVVKQHENLIKNNQYSDATALLNNKNIQKGARASLFNSLQEKIKKLQLYFLNQYVATDEDYFSTEEPTAEFMQENGYKFWIQPWKEE